MNDSIVYLEQCYDVAIVKYNVANCSIEKFSNSTINA